MVVFMLDRKKHSVLIVDDDRANIITLTHILSTEYTLYVAKNGMDAIRIAECYSPDVILLDINMPGIDGFEVFALLKNSELASDIPVIFVTGRSDEHSENRALEAGASDYITKPFSPAAISLRVSNQLKMRRVSTVGKRMVERRHCFRFASSLPVEIKRTEAAEDEEPYKGEIINVSDLGMLFTTDKELQRSEKISLTFDMNGKVSVNSLVLRVKRIKSEKYLYKAAVQFRSNTLQVRNQIYKYLLKEQMDKKNNPKQ